MVSSQKLAKNTFYLTLASVIQKIIAFAYFALVAQYIGVEGTGSYFLALAVTGIMAVFADVGLTSVLIREIAKEEKSPKEWVKNMIGLKLIFIPFTILITYFIPQVLGYDAELTLLIRIASLILIADTITLLFYGVLRGLHQLKYESVGIFMGQTISASIGTALLLTGKATLPLLILALLAGSSWNMLFSAWNVGRQLGWKSFVPSFSLGWQPLKVSFAFFLAAIFVKLYSYIDTITLSKVLGEMAVGIYAVAYKFTYAFQFLPLAFVAALYPTMSTYAKDQERLKSVLLQSFWYLGLLGFPIVFGIFSLADQIILTVYGEDFREAIPALQILIFALIPIFLDFPVGSLLNATDRQSTKMGLMGITMVINLIANLLLIPAIGVMGASIAGVISFTFLFVSGFLVVKPSLGLKYKEVFKTISGFFFSAVLMMIGVLLAKDHLPFVANMLLGAGIYSISIFVTGAMTIAHLKRMTGLIYKR